jgi:hypothetical protein
VRNLPRPVVHWCEQPPQLREHSHRFCYIVQRIGTGDEIKAFLREWKTNSLSCADFHQLYMRMWLVCEGKTRLREHVFACIHSIGLRIGYSIEQSSQQDPCSTDNV